LQTPPRLLIGEIDLLPKLYPHIAIPPAVQVELRNADAPDIVRAWIENPPAWLAIMAPHSSDDPRLSALDSGEREALALALELRADLVLIDERDARAVAELCGLTGGRHNACAGIGGESQSGRSRRGFWPAAVHQFSRSSILDGAVASAEREPSEGVTTVAEFVSDRELGALA